ncbi:hypothetical protein DPMN_077071 [Dreissena polymorpha]|uniref:Uncharacterized protein n=1 Tax=Dreissena polymorpha TaxID=45954 RepID=A0A9D3YMR9_DREPO|nr:hypothetical protein DPMN_077071 [Dreissena polymorpha]
MQKALQCPTRTRVPRARANRARSFVRTNRATRSRAMTSTYRPGSAAPNVRRIA